MWGLDLRNGTAVDFNKTGTYSTEMFTDEAVRRIRQHGKSSAESSPEDQAGTSNPLFLMINHQAPHTGNIFRPYEVPSIYLERVAHIGNPARRNHAALLASLDDSVGSVFKTLDEEEVRRGRLGGMEDRMVFSLNKNLRYSNF